MKQAIGRLINASAEDVILANSASYGLHLVANGFPWRAGDEVLVMRGDFPSDILPWLGLEPRGVTIRQLAPRGRVLEPDEIEAAIGPRTRLLCLTWVHSLSGWAIDLEAIGAICRARGVTFVVNGAQAVGVRPIDARTAPIDALVSVGWKWMLGPYATGFCWMRPELLAALRYNQTYWLSMLTADDLGREQLDLTLRDDPGAARYDVFATANFFNFKPWAASVEYLLDYGIEAARRHDDELVRRLIDGLDRRKYTVNQPGSGAAAFDPGLRRAPGTRAGRRSLSCLASRSRARRVARRRATLLAASLQHAWRHRPGAGGAASRLADFGALSRRPTVEMLLRQWLTP